VRCLESGCFDQLYPCLPLLSKWFDAWGSHGSWPLGKSTTLGRRLDSSCRSRGPLPGGGAIDRGSTAGGGPVGWGCDVVAGRLGRGFLAGGVSRGGRAPPEMPQPTRSANVGGFSWTESRHCSSAPRRCRASGVSAPLAASGSAGTSMNDVACVRQGIGRCADGRQGRGGEGEREGVVCWREVGEGACKIRNSGSKTC
jgi:hypothetical protein